MNSSRKKTPLAIIIVDLLKACKMAVTAIILMTICFSAVSPITPVASSSLEHHPDSRRMEQVNVCANPVISTDS